LREATTLMFSSWASTRDKGDFVTAADFR
jgi:hypothetical protein